MTDHKPDCQWQRTTAAECEYRETHHYCPHAEHVCDCIADPAPRREGAGDEKPMDYRHPLEMYHARREDAAGERYDAEWIRRMFDGVRVRFDPLNDCTLTDTKKLEKARALIAELLVALSTAEREREDAERYRALRADVEEFGYIDESWGTPEAFEHYADEIRARRARVPSGGEEGR